MKQDR